MRQREVVSSVVLPELQCSRKASFHHSLESGVESMPGLCSGAFCSDGNVLCQPVWGPPATFSVPSVSLVPPQCVTSPLSSSLLCSSIFTFFSYIFNCGYNHVALSLPPQTFLSVQWCPACSRCCALALQSLSILRNGNVVPIKH